MTLEETLLGILRDLPVNQQQEVLDFAKFSNHLTFKQLGNS
jgi:hypothetical protein